MWRYLPRLRMAALKRIGWLTAPRQAGIQSQGGCAASGIWWSARCFLYWTGRRWRFVHAKILDLKFSKRFLEIISAICYHVNEFWEKGKHHVNRLRSRFFKWSKSGSANRRIKKNRLLQNFFRQNNRKEEISTRLRPRTLTSTSRRYFSNLEARSFRL